MSWNQIPLPSPSLLVQPAAPFISEGKQVTDGKKGRGKK